MLDKKKHDYCKKSIGVIAVTGVVLASALICVFVYYIGRNQSKQISSVTKQISSVTIMFSEVAEDTPIDFVSFELAEGFDNIDGKSIIQAETGADGTANFEVPEGEYTLRWHGGSYFDGYQNVTVQGETVILRKCLIEGTQNPDQPIEEANDTHSAYILLEWQSEENLDLCVYQEENDRCIGIEQTKDAEGSFLYRDNSGDQGYELVYLKDAAVGNYRIYVKDCDSILNDRESRMEAEGVSVSIYTAQGAVYQKSAEAGESAGLWECASLCGGEVFGQDRYLYDLTDYAWALRDGDDPASWLEGAYIKAEEIYFYPYGDHRLPDHQRLPDDGLLDGRLPDDRLLYNVTRKEFDADENITVETQYNADGEQTARFVYEYDENGNRIAEYVFYYKRLDLPGGGEQPNKIWEWKYSEEGELIGYCEYDADGIVASQYEQTYDENGNLIKEYTYPYGEYDNSSEECQYEYDTDGHRTAEIHYIDGEKTYRKEYEYDEDGKETVCYVYYYHYDSEDDYLERRCESEYDENGNLKVYTLYICSGNIFVTEYGYDTDGNCIAEYMCSYSLDGELGHREKLEFDSSGRVTLRAVGEGEFWKSQFIEEYDDRGNETATYLYEYDGNEVSSVIIDEYEYQYDDMGNETAYYHCEDGSRTLYRATAYVYDARAGMKIEYCDVGRSLTKTITIYGFGENAAEE